METTTRSSGLPKISGFWPMVVMIAAGQFVCITYSSFGAFNTLLNEKGLDIASTSTLAANLVTLPLFLFSCSRIPKGMKTPYLYFLLCSVLDTASYVCNVYAYQYTTITNNNLMQTFGIIVAAFLSMCLFKLRYLWIHYFGMLIGLIGMVVTVWHDLTNPDSSSSEKNLLGVLFAILATSCFSVEVVFQEKLLNDGVPPFAYLAYVSLYSTVFSTVCIFATLEYKQFQEYKGDWIYLWYELPQALSLLANKISIVYFINYYNATAYSIIALCGVLYSMLFDIFIFDAPFQYLVLVGYALIILAVVVFHLREPRKVKSKHYKVLLEDRETEAEQNKLEE